MPEPIPQDVHEILQPAVVRGDGPVGERDLERPVVREAQEEPCQHGLVRDSEPLATRQGSEPLRQGFPELGRTAGRGARQRGGVERRMHHHAQGERDDLGEILAEPTEHGTQVFVRVVGRVLWAEQLLDIRPARVHRREEEGVLAAETLIEDRLRDTGGLRDLPRRHGMPVFAEDVARDPEDFVVGNRFGAAHAPQFRAMSARVPSRLVREPMGSEKRTRGRLWTNKRALANIRLASIVSATGLAAGSMASPQAASNFKEPRVMPRTPLRYRTLLVCGVLALAGRPALADDGKGDKNKPIPAGTWEKKDAEPKLEFTGEDKLTIFPHGDNVEFQIDCSYTVTKDGLVKAKITQPRRPGGRD